MNRTIILTLLSLSSWLAATLLPAQPVSPRQSTSSRFLLVVDTSFSMAPQKAVLCNTARDLLDGAFRNQMKPGDTFSVWTFNQDTDTQQFPALEWNPDLKAILANQVSAFLNNQPFQKISRLDRALPEILGLTRDSRKLTVFILSDGLEFFQGTPFDVRINEVYRERSRELRQAGKPFITLLQAMDGQIVGWSVSAAGETIQIAQRPASIPSAAPLVRSEPTSPRLGSALDAVGSGSAQPVLVKAPTPGVARPNLIIRAFLPTDDASSSSAPAADEEAIGLAALSERTKLQRRFPPQSVEPDSGRLNLLPAPTMARTPPASASAAPSPSALPVAALSATSAIAIASPAQASSVTSKPGKVSPATLEAASTLTATPIENSFTKTESLKSSPEITPRGEKTGEQKIAVPAEIQAPPQPPPATTPSPKNTFAPPNVTATPGRETSVKLPQSDVESPSRAALAPAQAAPISHGKTERDPAIEKSTAAPRHPVPDVRSAANSKAQVAVPPSADSSTGAQIAVLAPGPASPFNWGYFALGLTSLLAALPVIYLLTRRTRAPRQSSLISRSIERK